MNSIRRLMGRWAAPAIGCLMLFGLAGTALARDPYPLPPIYTNAVAKATATGKPILFYFYLDWSGPCQKTAAQMRQIPGTIARFVYCPANAEQERALLRKLYVHGYPCILILRSDEVELYRRMDTYKDAQEMKAALDEALAKAGTGGSEEPSTNTPATSVTSTNQPPDKK